MIIRVPSMKRLHLTDQGGAGLRDTGRVVGSLVAPDGHQYMLNLLYRYVWDPGTTKYNEVFKLQLTPAGK